MKEEMRDEKETRDFSNRTTTTGVDPVLNPPPPSVGVTCVRRTWLTEDEKKEWLESVD